MDEDIKNLILRSSAEFAQAMNKVRELSPIAAQRILSGEIKDAISELPKVAKDDELLRELVRRLENDNCKKSVKGIKRDVIREKMKNAWRVSFEQGRYTPVIYHRDGIEWCQEQLELGNSYDMLLTDPPYSTDVDNIQEFSKWIVPALSIIKPTGRAYICIGNYPQEIYAYLNTWYNFVPKQLRDRFELANILVWTYKNTLGAQPKKTYKNNWQAVLYFIGRDAGDLNSDLLVELFSVHEINAPDSRFGVRFHPWQKPELLAKRFITHSTKEGDTVIDPFAGTGTFGLVASSLNRRYIGCEIDENMLNIANMRGCHVCR